MRAVARLGAVLVVDGPVTSFGRVRSGHPSLASCETRLAPCFQA